MTFIDQVKIIFNTEGENLMLYRPNGREESWAWALPNSCKGELQEGGVRGWRLQAEDLETAYAKVANPFNWDGIISGFLNYSDAKLCFASLSSYLRSCGFAWQNGLSEQSKALLKAKEPEMGHICPVSLFRSLRWAALFPQDSNPRSVSLMMGFLELHVFARSSEKVAGIPLTSFYFSSQKRTLESRLKARTGSDAEEFYLLDLQQLPCSVKTEILKGDIFGDLWVSIARYLPKAPLQFQQQIFKRAVEEERGVVCHFILKLWSQSKTDFRHRSTWALDVLFPYSTKKEKSCRGSGAFFFIPQEQGRLILASLDRCSLLHSLQNDAYDGDLFLDILAEYPGGLNLNSELLQIAIGFLSHVLKSPYNLPWLQRVLSGTPALYARLLPELWRQNSLPNLLVELVDAYRDDLSGKNYEGWKEWMEAFKKLPAPLILHFLAGQASTKDGEKGEPISALAKCSEASRRVAYQHLKGFRSLWSKRQRALSKQWVPQDLWPSHLRLQA